MISAFELVKIFVWKRQCPALPLILLGRESITRWQHRSDEYAKK